MTFQEFKQWVMGKIIEYPLLKSDISEFYYLALTEIADGESEHMEIEKAINDIKELING